MYIPNSEEGFFNTSWLEKTLGSKSTKTKGEAWTNEKKPIFFLIMIVNVLK